MKKTTHILIAVFGLTATFSFGQQVGLNSQYMQNQMVYNPGATGTLDYIPVQLNFRKQWVQFPDSPTSQFLSAHSKVGKNMGFGAVLNNEVAGPSRHTGLTINGSYQLRISKNNYHRIGMGLGLSLSQHSIDGDKLNTYLPDDPAVTRGFNNVVVPDASAGFYYYFKDKGYFGVSGRNLVQMDRDLYKFQNPLYNPMVRNYYAVGGYSFALAKKFDLRVSGVFQMIESGVWQAEGSLLGVFLNRFWIGGSYRNTDAVVFMGGVQFGQFRLGYSYDYTLSDISTYSQGSHEIMLELQLNKGNKTNGATNGSSTPWLKRNRVYKAGN